MPNLIEKYPILIVAAAIGGGIMVKRYLTNRRETVIGNKAQALRDDSNPWSIGTGAMNAYEYYATSTNETRFVYGVGQEVNLVSTDMLQNALDNQRADIIEEMHTYVSSQLDGFDNYMNYNPYDVAIAGASNGAQMALPNYQTEGGHD